MEYFKIEIIISNSFLQDLIDALEELGVHGYTALEIVKGKGAKQGERLTEGLLPVTQSSLVFTIAPKELALNIKQVIQPYLDERGGVLIISSIRYATGLSLS